MKNLSILLIISLLSTETHAQKSILKSKIDQYLQQLPAEIKVSMAVEDLQGKKLFTFRENEKVPSASVIKVPIMVELMEQVKAKKINLEEKYEIKDSDKAGGSGILAEEKNHKTLTIRELCQEMIRVSDNTATNILIKKLGMEKINARLEKLGLHQTRLNRIMMDTAAVKQGRENWINVLEINELLRKIYFKKVATPLLCDEMMKILKNCEDKTTIPRNIPSEIKIAHKTGGLPYVRGDAAIIFTKMPFIISIFVEGFKNIEDAEKMIGDLGEICFNSLK
jgi:beta-lactamase class A